MTEHLQPEPGTPSKPPASAGAPSARDDRRSQRRQFLIGSGAFGGTMMTLANRPVLAANTCTVSAIGSLNPSQPVNQKCGNSPGCWGNNNGFPTWADGKTFNNVALPYTHSTPITTPLSVLGSAPFSASGVTLQDMILNPGSIVSAITVKLKNGTSVPVWNQGQALNIAAAILNDEFFGTHYYPTSIITYITGFLSTNQKSVVFYAHNNDTSSISSLMSTLGGTLDSLNNQGEVCPP